MSIFDKIKSLLTATGTPDSDDLVSVGTYPNEAEAYITKGLLDSNGIPAMVGSNAQIYTPQIKTGVSVYVFYRDLDKAHSLLDGAK